MRQRSPRSLSLRFVLPVLLVCAAATCFSAKTAHAGELAGCWEGCWDNWHDAFVGRVKAKIWKCNETQYCGEFSGIALLVIPYRYRATLNVTRVEGDKTYFSSYRHLPIWGGYKMCGYVSGCKFFAKYYKCDGSGGGCWWMDRTCGCNCGGGCCCKSN